MGGEKKNVSSKSLKRAYRGGGFGQEAAKIAIFNVFLRYHNTNNYKHLPLSQELLHKWKEILLTAWESSSIYVFSPDQ